MYSNLIRISPKLIWRIEVYFYLILFSLSFPLIYSLALFVFGINNFRILGFFIGLGLTCIFPIYFLILNAQPITDTIILNNSIIPTTNIINYLRIKNGIMFNIIDKIDIDFTVDKKIKEIIIIYNGIEYQYNENYFKEEDIKKLFAILKERTPMLL